ncbi:MAG: T9SS type A sorting domain-containing protein [Ginsengibacter sp.]
MQKFYICIKIAFCFSVFFISNVRAQNCALLNATFTSYESRCAATGSIKVTPTGGSGSYKYKTIGPVNSNFTTSDSITGLSAGIYTVVINDIVTNCTFTQNNVVVSGTYEDPRFNLSEIDVSCDNGNNGSVTVTNVQGGRPPFAYTLVAPSAMGIGTTNGTGIFNNLIAGDYSIQMTDSCGGIQTRLITVNNYSWWISSYVFNKVSCDSASGYIIAIDSKGRVSNAGGIPGFTYGAVRQPGDTVWSSSANFSLYVAGLSNFEIIVKDNCGKIKTGNVSIFLSPDLGANVTIYGITCDRFSAALSGITNFFNPDFCLYDSNNVQVSCNTTGDFTNLPFGSYCIKAHDGCTDSVISRCFTAYPPPLSIDNIVLITNKNCFTFSASITGQVGLYNPDYCLYDLANVLLVCNTTGVFDNLPYGNYCIEMKDGCRDTTIQRCFSASRPTPVVDQIITPSYISCSSFGIVVNGDSLTNPSYCLYDSLGALIICNSTGIFDSLSLGNYCVNIYDACLDTTFIRCFTAGPPVVVNNIVVGFSNKICTTFTATASGSNLNNPFYCLYDNLDSLISCDSTGIFNNLPYGSYCIKTKNACPDTTFINCFTVIQPIPSVNSNAKLSNYTCSDFTAKIIGQQNLTTPDYCLYDSLDQLIGCNSTGIFNNLSYGNYCIKITNSCYDTVITRCFSAATLPVNLSVTSNKSCVYGYAKLSITVGGGYLPVNIKIIDPNGNLFLNNNYNTTNISIDSISGLLPGQTYKVIATDNCGKQDSVDVAVITSYVNHSLYVDPKCPGGAWPNGSGDIKATATSNMGSMTVHIVKKDALWINPQQLPSLVSGNVHTFDDQGPGTYILNFKANDACNIFILDTVVVKPYTFPNLTRSSAYQCDVNGFSVGAVASDGVGPFSYSIIGSSPALPSIVAGPQASPVFNINNGNNYSLIRLRALDACGNATLGDASILPLADEGIISSSNCFLQPTTLTVDSIYNSTYEWYKKDTLDGKDSTLIAVGTSSYYIAGVLPSDTGIYVCHLSVLNGCVSRTYYYNLNGSCFTALPVTLLDFSGKFANEKVLLNWKTVKENNLEVYIIERKNLDGTFSEIGRINPAGNVSYSQQYYFIDQDPPPGNNSYRLKLVNYDRTVSFSDVIVMSKTQAFPDIHLFPNPASDVLTIEFRNSLNHVYKITIMNLINQVVSETKFNSGVNKKLEIKRTKAISPGVYIVRFNDLNNNDEFSQKIIFR